MDNDFGKYLRELRESRSSQVLQEILTSLKIDNSQYKKRKPIVTQEMLATSVGRDKMTICLIEQGKNDPPQGDFLQKIVEVLYLNDDEKNKLFDLAAKKRKTIPQDILDYFHSHPELIKAIRRAKEKNMPDSVWAEVIKE